MGILDNLEAYWEKAGDTEKCHYCNTPAKYNDLAEIDKSKYDIVGVCEGHAFKGLSS